MKQYNKRYDAEYVNRRWKKQDNRDVDFFLSQWFFAIILIVVILGADAFSEWGASVISFIVNQILGD